MADHIGQFPVVMISPYDVDLIKEGSEIRRKWIDGIISQFDAAFLATLQRYNKVLDQRNALLKQQYENGLFQREPLEIWDEQLVRYADEIHQKRSDFTQELIPLFQQFYSVLSGNREEVVLQYESQLKEAKLEDLLIQAYPRDSRSTHTSVGVHKDDFSFLLNGQPVKKFGSQGQQKCFLIALKLAQFAWLKDRLSQTPVLLLDDIFDKLDNERVAQLMRMVSDNLFNQVIVTDTDEDRVKRIFSSIDIIPNIISYEREEEII
jgi:DNA replication and repair protein RecF